jgi:hypothetical protein
MKNEIISIFIVLMLVPLVSSDSGLLTVTKTGVDTVRYGDRLDVTITVTSNSDEQLDVVVEEMLSGDLISPKNALIETYEPLYRPPYMRWEFTLEPYEEKEIEYTVEPLYPGDFIIIPTGVYADGEYYESNYIEAVVKCRANGRCEIDDGEDYLTCPEDCTSGIEDGGCDLLEDGRCDPDCIEGYDPDCSEDLGDDDLLSQISENPMLVLIPLISMIVIILFLLLIRRRASRDSSGDVVYDA